MGRRVSVADAAAVSPPRVMQVPVPGALPGGQRRVPRGRGDPPLPVRDRRQQGGSRFLFSSPVLLNLTGLKHVFFPEKEN